MIFLIIGYGRNKDACLGKLKFDSSGTLGVYFKIAIAMSATVKKTKEAIFLLIIIGGLFLSIFAQGIRNPIWAGKFYQAQPDLLSSQLDTFLAQDQKNTPSGQIVAITVPHAGYVYSGHVAAAAYSLIRDQDYKTVVVIGPSHYYGFKGCSIYLRGGYKTPLGIAVVDEELAAKIAKASGFTYIPKAHQQEHSIEVQIPFIQKTLPQAKIVPIVMGYQTEKTITRLAKALVEALPADKVLVIASTDLSHFYSRDKANKTDAQTISLIQNFKINTLLKKIERRENIMCGGGPVISTLLYARKKGPAKVKALKYSDSSQAGTSPDRVVGYLAAAVYLETSHSKFSLSSSEKKELIRLAQSAIENFTLEKKILNYQPQDTKLLTPKGVFVTIKKEGRLRGCIGFIQPVLPLYKAVIQSAIYAACRDPRFPPLSPNELNHLEIEISVLSPLKKISNPHLVTVGQHGLLIAKGEKRGVLLPQVPVENNWSRTVFLEQACRKAGLPKDIWKHGAEIFVFEAVVFH